MPNVAPRGWWGRGSTGAAGEVTDAWVGDPDGTGEYVPIETVFCWDEALGEYVVLWSRTAGSPVSAAASYQTSPGTQVTVEWVLPDPHLADSFNIRRPDGSLAGTVASSQTTFVDPDPRPLNGAYRVHGVLAGQQGPATLTNSLDLRLPPATVNTSVVDNGTASSSVTVTWTHNALGRPDQYAVYRDDTLVGTVSGTTLAFSDENPLRGQVSTYSVRARLSGVTSAIGTAASATSVAAAPPPSATLAATNPPLSNLRLTWTHPAGSRTGYETEYDTNNNVFIGTASHGSSVTERNLGSTVARRMRVRTLSDGGPSAWVTRGPTTPINDVTPPGPASITSWQPEASYGRMVVRFTTPADADFNSYRVQERVGTGAWSDVTSWVTGSPSTSYSQVCSTRSAGQSARVRIQVRDNDMNEATGSEVIYELLASPYVFSPAGDLGGTWRVNEWRNDGSPIVTGQVAQGGTGFGQNYGHWFYDQPAIAAALGGRTLVSATMQYYRLAGGASAARQPLVWNHNLVNRAGHSAGDPPLFDAGLTDAQRRLTGVGTNAGATSPLPLALVTAIVNGTRRGLVFYDPSGSGNPTTPYMVFGIAGTTYGAFVNGRVSVSHLG